MQLEINYTKDLADFSAAELYHAYSNKIEKEVTRAIGHPADAALILHKFRNNKQESLWSIFLDGAHNVLLVKEISKGILNRTLVHPREVFRPGILMSAMAVIVAHNHPSGNKEPSREDDELTVKIKKAGEIIGIPVLDHVIISKNGYYSYLEENKL